MTNKRSNNYWEPIYAPEEHAPFEQGNWEINPQQTIVHQELNAEQFYTKNATDYTKFSKAHFKSCNFQGDFSRKNNNIKFEECNFTYCDFGHSKWSNVKFSKCTFTKCSFSFTEINKSQFMYCNFKDIGFSGNETSIHDTLITNPWEFVASGYTNTDKHVLAQMGKTPDYQLTRLEETKAKIARLLIHSLEWQGDDEIYYEAVKTYILQLIKQKYHSARYQYRNRKGLSKFAYGIKMNLAKLEQVVIGLSGLVNNWGLSVGRPVLVGAALTIVFALLYYNLGLAKGIFKSLLMSFDTTFLVGYSKYPPKDSQPWVEYIFAFNVFLGIWWYAVFIPTIINRVCRVRG